MPDPFVGEVRCFAFGFAPVGWLPCAGQLLSINQYTALFSVIGTAYGGDGSTTFAVPDLRGRVSMSPGQGVGLSSYALGQAGGDESVTLVANQIPSHGHPVAASSAATAKSPGGAVPAYTSSAASYGTTEDLAMSVTMAGENVGDEPHPNLQPYLVLNWCIALQGEFPSRS